MKIIVKVFVLSIYCLVLTACATNSDIQSVEQLAIEGQKNIAKLDKKISQLELEKTALTEQLNAIDSGVSKAIEIKEKIASIDSNISDYKSEIKTLNIQMATNSSNIAVVKNQQKVQHAAAADAIKENEALKLQAIEEIEALEREYAEKRNNAKNDNKENNKEDNE